MAQCLNSLPSPVAQYPAPYVAHPEPHVIHPKPYAAHPTPYVAHPDAHLSVPHQPVEHKLPKKCHTEYTSVVSKVSNLVKLWGGNGDFDQCKFSALQIK